MNYVWVCKNSKAIIIQILVYISYIDVNENNLNNYGFVYLFLQPIIHSFKKKTHPQNKYFLTWVLGYLQELPKTEQMSKKKDPKIFD